jgi:hypothetical protein
MPCRPPVAAGHAAALLHRLARRRRQAPHTTTTPLAPAQVSSLDSRAVFYWALAPMAAFYALFAAVLLPNVDALQPTALAAQYCSQLVRALRPA